MSHRLTLSAIIAEPDGAARAIIVKGQYARMLRALVEAGAQGVTSLDISKTWALRTSHYVFILRRDYGLSIDMDLEPHDGPAGPGWHGRYTLRSSVQLVESNGERAAA